jgi:hypothetical protein
MCFLLHNYPTRRCRAARAYYTVAGAGRITASRLTTNQMFAHPKGNGAL